MASIDVSNVLAAGAYGTGLLFFVYGAYVLPKARTPEQGRNMRWYLGIGAVVFLALAGLDLAKLLHRERVLEPEVYLEFSPTFSLAGLPEPSVRYRGAVQPNATGIQVVDSNATISISVERIIDAVKQLRARNDHLQVAYGRAIASVQPEAFTDRVAAAAPDISTCDPASALCGWAKLSQGHLEDAQASFEQALQTTTPENKAERAAALQGLGEIYVGQGRLDQAEDVLAKASRLGNAEAGRRLEHVAEIRASK